MYIPLNDENISSGMNSFDLGSHFCRQNEHMSVKEMKLTGTCKAVNCFLDIAHVKYSYSDISFASTSTSTFIKSVKSVQTSHQATCAQSEKTI